MRECRSGVAGVDVGGHLRIEVKRNPFQRKDSGAWETLAAAAECTQRQAAGGRTESFLRDFREIKKKRRLVELPGAASRTPFSYSLNGAIDFVNGVVETEEVR